VLVVRRQPYRFYPFARLDIAEKLSSAEPIRPHKTVRGQRGLLVQCMCRTTYIEARDVKQLAGTATGARSVFQ